MECENCLIFVHYMFLTTKKRPDTNIVLMCICVNNTWNKKSAILRYQISENMNHSTESTKKVNVNNLD